ncbi:hypothetical protein K2173_020539 [Erythroxylum novogranatense]|uniref:Uncharacterized protein n=1 Tax=Erythroxylum novogranatense TaxID=1862640 RepID=A0AAV8TJ88_9ROSI|nr:hypothetical protein K2173_020539 [Erythroxylum novogranatense]
MSEYSFKKVLSLDEYATFFENIDPASQYKKWTTQNVFDKGVTPMNMAKRYDNHTETVKAIFVVSDPVDWGRDIQVLCDVLSSGGLPGLNNGHQPPLYFTTDDLAYQAAFSSKRLGMGAFRIALENVFNRTSHGKPNPFVFENPYCSLENLAQIHSHSLKTLYMIGDNPSVDVKGGRQVQYSILFSGRTSLVGESNHAEFPADLLVDTVEEAVDYILERELGSRFGLVRFLFVYRKIKRE